MANMTNLAEQKQYNYNKGEVINFPTKAKLKKDGTIKQVQSNSVKGKAKEVYPIKNKEDVLAIQSYFKNKMDSATNEEDKQIAGRNLLMWTMGINLGLRAGDLLSLKWGEVFNEDGTFKNGVRKLEEKTNKYKTFFLNQYIKDAIKYYIDEFRVNTDENEYIFKSRVGGHISVDMAGKALKQATKDCNIKVNVNTHTMRKSFGYHWYMAHQDDVKALNILQHLFNHSSELVTLRYIGLEDEENEQYYNDLKW